MWRKWWPGLPRPLPCLSTQGAGIGAEPRRRILRLGPRNGLTGRPRQYCPPPLRANVPSPHHRCRTLPLVDIINKRHWGQIRCRFPGHTTKNYQQNTLSLTDTGHVQTTKDKQTNPITQSAKGNATYSTRRRDIPTRRSRGIRTYCK